MNMYAIKHKKHGLLNVWSYATGDGGVRYELDFDECDHDYPIWTTNNLENAERVNNNISPDSLWGNIVGCESWCPYNPHFEKTNVVELKISIL